ncbi:hypothetical protein PPTG_23424 [Phytophthora nicotianae INRA-310]|uniref:Uncharacterized protein n=1 Tax=Phytophthora nicotianae (strain INRA-310) TaxID=761204 RepID=W2PYL7_PHYN3|nr:hypothetical protein PPTG_23424 [Phytophthora nicotianae INRA-310]ETN05741.1 hypothetical protein PPTG_23424 [Phytophthora nicotianae INRA-310]
MEKQLAALLESIMHISVKAERKKKGQAVPCQLLLSNAKDADDDALLLAVGAATHAKQQKTFNTQ